MVSQRRSADRTEIGILALTRRFGTELGALALAGGRAWIHLLPQLLALTLLGWSAYYGSVLLSARLAVWSAWLVIVGLALGVTARLATLVVSLRVVAEHLGVSTLLRSLASDERIDDDRDQSLSRLLTITMLPFLAVYASFGYVNSFVQDLAMMSVTSIGLATLLQDLNPTTSTVAMVAVGAVIVGLFLARRGLDRLLDRRRTVVLGIVAVVIEASFLLIVALSGFRLVEAFQLWLNDRAVRSWIDTAMHTLSQLLRIDLPVFFTTVWEIFVESVWPVLWEVISQPLAWLALTALVFGSRVLSLQDLWTQTPEQQSTPSRLAQIRGQLAQASGLRRAVLRVQGAFFSDVDDKYLPTWWALKLVLRAGWLPLAAFVTAYNLVRLSGEWVEVQVLRAIGGGSFTEGLLLAPVVALIPDVVVLSAQLALLGAAFARVLQQRERSDSPRTAAPAPGDRRTSAAEVVLVAALLAGFTGLSLLEPSQSAQQHTVAVGTPSTLDGKLVTVNKVRYGDSLASASNPELGRSRLAFVVVTAAVYARSGPATTVAMQLHNGSRRYHSGSWGSFGLNAELGFQQSGDLVFEVDPADLNSHLEAIMTTSAFVTGFHDEVHIELGIPDSAPTRVAGQQVFVVAAPPREAP